MTVHEGAEPGPGDEVVRRWVAARAQARARRGARLASDADRDGVCDLLNGAFSDGRLTAGDLDERTSQALSARTHGDLEAVLDGLVLRGSAAPWSARPDRGVVPRVVFWLVGFFTSPFVFAGSMLLLFGSDFGDRVFGIVMLVIFLPGLIALHRWAYPRR